jgi:hypothetical protein
VVDGRLEVVLVDVVLLGAVLVETAAGGSSASGDRSASAEHDVSATTAPAIQMLARTRRVWHHGVCR